MEYKLEGWLKDVPLTVSDSVTPTKEEEDQLDWRPPHGKTQRLYTEDQVRALVEAARLVLTYGDDYTYRKEKLESALKPFEKL